MSAEQDIVPPELNLPETGSFTILATFEVKPEKVSFIDASVKKNKEYTTAHESGTLQFHISRKENKFYIWETYANKEAFAFHHKNNPELQKVKVAAADIFLAPPHIEVLQFIA